MLPCESELNQQENATL